MPNIKSATKRMHLSRKRAAHNRTARTRLRTAIKGVRNAPDVETAEARLSEAVALLDRAGRKHLYHPKKAARVKSQLQRHVNGLRES